MICYGSFPVSKQPCSGLLKLQKLRSPLLGTQNYWKCHLSIKPREGQNIALCAFPSDRISAFLISVFPVLFMSYVLNSFQTCIVSVMNSEDELWTAEFCFASMTFWSLTGFECWVTTHPENVYRAMIYRGHLEQLHAVLVSDICADYKHMPLSMISVCVCLIYSVQHQCHVMSILTLSDQFSENMPLLLNSL